MWNLKRNDASELSKQKETHRLIKWTYSCWGEGMVREFGMVMYTLLSLKWITNKDLLYSTWNSAQCYVAVWMEEGIYLYDWVPFLFTWSYHNIVNWLYPNTKLKVQNKKKNKNSKIPAKKKKARHIDQWNRESRNEPTLIRSINLTQEHTMRKRQPLE